MRNNLFKIYIAAFFVLSDFVMFAQPGEEDSGGDLEGGDAPAAPINGKLIWLGIAAIIFAFYSYKRNRKIA